MLVYQNTTFTIATLRRLHHEEAVSSQLSIPKETIMHSGHANYRQESISNMFTGNSFN